LERAGTSEKGAITGLFTVLVEGDDMNDPVADAVRSILDGHIVLNRQLATENHYPAIDVLESVSRLTRDLTTTKQQEFSGRARNLLALLRKNQDLINIGAYVAGSNPEIDRALSLQKSLRDFLQQGIGEGYPAAKSWEMLESAIAIKTK
jgi:flagellum-specific ATP synthase